jgi:holo-[acyl-carrier protein] synthase
MAVYSIGVDIAEIERIDDLIKRYGNRFLKRVFTDNEIEYCSKKVTAASSYAVRFATKEAVFKATGLGLNQGMGWRDIEVLNDQNGKPFIKLSGVTKENLRGKKIHVSLSHSKDLAIAMVVVEE